MKESEGEKHKCEKERKEKKKEENCKLSQTCWIV